MKILISRWGYTLLALALISLSTSCHIQDNLPECNLGPKVHIQLEASLPSNATRCDASLRGSDITTGQSKGNQYEQTVRVLRVMAFDAKGTIVYNQLHGLNLTDDNPYHPAAQKRFESVGDNKYRINLETPTGRIRLVMIANERKDMATKLSNLKTLSELQSCPALTNFNDYNNDHTKCGLGSDRIVDSNGQTTVISDSQKPYILMVGSQMYKVKYNSASSEANPTIVTPAIELERAIAKVEVNLRRVIDKDNNSQYMKVKEVNLVKIQTRYNVLNRSTFDNLSPVTQTLVSHSVHLDTDAVLLPTDNYKNLINFYVAERFGINDVKDAMIIEVKTEGKAGTPFSGRHAEYYIPFYQRNTSGIASYDVMRNRIYRLNLDLKGQQVLYNQLNVLPWNVSNSNIKFDDTPIAFTCSLNQTEYEVSKRNPLKFNLKITSGPKDLIWHASLDNGLEFEFTDQQSTYGSIGQEKELTISPTKEYLPGRQTNFFVLIKIPGRGISTRFPIITGTNGQADQTDVLIKQVE